MMGTFACRKAGRGRAFRYCLAFLVAKKKKREKMQKIGGHIITRECLWEDSRESCNSERDLKEEA